MLPGAPATVKQAPDPDLRRVAWVDDPHPLPPGRRAQMLLQGGPRWESYLPLYTRP